MGHKEFLATQQAKTNAMKKRHKKHRKQRQFDKACGGIDLFLCLFITGFFFLANTGLGLIAFVLMALPCLLDEWRNQITKPPWTTVQGEPDCFVCKGKYFLSNGILTYWLGWRECQNCTPKRHFSKKQTEP